MGMFVLTGSKAVLTRFQAFWTEKARQGRERERREEEEKRREEKRREEKKKVDQGTSEVVVLKELKDTQLNLHSLPKGWFFLK